jgi:hypothetical protein
MGRLQGTHVVLLQLRTAPFTAMLCQGWIARIRCDAVIIPGEHSSDKFMKSARNEASFL